MSNEALKIAKATVEECERLKDMGNIMLSRTSLLILAEGYISLHRHLSQDERAALDRHTKDA